MSDTTQKPLNAIAHELLTGKPCFWESHSQFWCEDWGDYLPVPQYDLTEEEYAELVRLLQQPYYHERTGERLTDPEAIAVDAWFDCDREKWPRVDRVLGVRFLKESYDTYLKGSNARACKPEESQ